MDSQITFRKAIKGDIPFIVEMLANDVLGKQREDFRDPLPEKYWTAFENISNDPNQELIVLDNGKEVIGTLQLSFIQYLTYQGGIRAQIEAVRIKDGYTGKGFGEHLFQWAINRARERGAHIIQLTSDKKNQTLSAFTKSSVLRRHMKA